MGSHQIKTLVSGLILAGFAAAMPVKADSLLSYTDTQAVSPADTRFDPANPVAFNLPQFNSSLGTLISATLSVSGSAISSLVFTNNDGPNAGVRTSETNALIINYNAGVLAENDFIWLTTNYPTLQKPGSGGVYSQSWGPATVQTLITFNSASDLANFTGGGNVPISAQFNDWFDEYYTGGNANSAIVTTACDFTANITYDFAPVPEPSSCGLFFGGLGLLIGIHCLRHWNPALKKHRVFTDYRE